MAWLIEPAYLGKKMTKKTQAQVDALVGAGTARSLGGGWYLSTAVPAPILVPVNILPPLINGSPKVGVATTVTLGTWSNSPVSYTYKWYLAGVVIAGATTNSYTPVVGDVGNELVAEVIATNPSGPSAPARSQPSAPVAAAVVDDQSGPQPAPPPPEPFPDPEPEPDPCDDDDDEDDDDEHQGLYEDMLDDEEDGGTKTARKTPRKTRDTKTGKN